jgi:hypothetical protein
MNCVAKAAIQTALSDGVRDFATIYDYIIRWHIGIEEWQPTEQEVYNALKRLNKYGLFGLNS